MFGFPLLLIPLAIVNIIAFLMPGVTLTAPLSTLALPSQQSLVVTLGDAVVLLGIVLMLGEVAKAARHGTRGLMDHLLALAAAGFAVGEFAWLPAFAQPAFLVLTVLTIVEFLAGIVLSLRRRAPASGRMAAPTSGIEAPVQADVPTEAGRA